MGNFICIENFQVPVHLGESNWCCGGSQNRGGGQASGFFRGPSPLLTTHEKKQTALLHLYLYQRWGSPPNQVFLHELSPNHYGSFLIKNWTVHETSDPNSTEIARARGLYGGCNPDKQHFYSSFNIAFEDHTMFRGSSLEVQGMWDINHNSRLEWAIVGGTGQFRLAQGIIVGHVDSENHEGRVLKVKIHVLYHQIEIPD